MVDQIRKYDWTPKADSPIRGEPIIKQWNKPVSGTELYFLRGVVVGAIVEAMAFLFIWWMWL